MNIAHHQTQTSIDTDLRELLCTTPAPAAETKNYAQTITSALEDVIQQMGDILMKKLRVLLPDL